MTFTNVSVRSLYMQCCHREVAPGETFIVPWHEVKDSIAVRSAMSNGELAWESAGDEPRIPGSPKVRRQTAEEADAAKEAAAKAAKAEEERMRRRMEEDDRAVMDNMARMGDFNVPILRDLERKVQSLSVEVPVTEEDVIPEDSKPKSLADIQRHNKAVRRFGRKDK